MILLAVCASCKRQEISVSDVPRQTATPRAGVPEGWEELPPDQMKVANFAIEQRDGSKAQVSVVPLPGASGSELDNVNRWRGQLGLKPITADELPKQTTEIKISGTPAHLFELSGIAPGAERTSRILAALQKRGDSIWFFKMMGDAELVNQQKAAFLSYLAAYKYPESAAGFGSVSPAPAPAAIAQPAASARWKAPAGWEPQPPGPMQEAKFLAAGGKVTATISIFGGPAGGTLANVNRWRGQLGLAPVEEKSLASLLSPLDLPESRANLVDMAGATERMIAAIVPRGDRTWFFKIVGDPVAVGNEKENFIQFVQTTK